MADFRMKQTVHVAHPDTGAVEQLIEGRPAPEWVTKLVDEGLLTDDLVEQAGPGALPESLVTKKS